MPLADPNFLHHTLRPLPEAQPRDPGIAPLSAHCHFREAPEVAHLLQNSLAPPGDELARASDPAHLKAELKIPETLVNDVSVGQRAEVATRNGLIEGEVSRIDPAAVEGTVLVDIKLLGETPRGARPDLSVDGTIELERLEDVLHVGRPIHAREESLMGLFKLEADGTHASRVQVRVGKVSVSMIEVRSGLSEGDKVVLSDMAAWDEYDRIRLE